MRGKKRAYILLSLLTIGTLLIPGQAVVQANEDLGLSEEILSTNEMDEAAEETELLGNETEMENDDASEEVIEAEIKYDDASEQIIEANQPAEDEELVSENRIINTVSENKDDIQPKQPQLSKEKVLFDAVNAEKTPEDTKISENQSSKEESKKCLDVILPTEIPFNIILFGEEGFDALISSGHYCIENRSEEDVHIFIQGTCSGNDGENYIMSASSVIEDYVENKKNVWVYLQWEDEEGRLLEKPGITMGDHLKPGSGEIILKAPKKDKNGEIIGENKDSKAYFSFRGDMKSDSGEIWKSEELKLGLDFSMNAVKKDEADEEDNPNTAAEDMKESGATAEDNPNMAEDIQENENSVNEEIEGF